MWLSKEKYKELKEYYDSSEEMKSQFENKSKELDELIAKCEVMKNSPNVKYTLVAEPEVDEEATYWNNISKVLDNKYFKWFTYKFREALLSKLGDNPERISGAIEGLDMFINEMKKLQTAYKNLLEAENARSDEN